MLRAPGDDVDGLVFVSYSHDDAAWARRFRVLLKPLVRRKQLRLWDDTAIRVGDEWHPAVGEAIGRSRVALVLVSADLLASDYVVEQELPALRLAGVLLAPVLIGDCFWEAVPELAAVQWLHDPGRDGPLGLHAGNAAERDRRIHRACNRLLTVAPEPAAAGPAPAPPPSPAPAAPAAPAAVPVPVLPPAPGDGPSTRGPAAPGGRRSGGPRPGGPGSGAAGPLSGVPALPPGYVVRVELDELVDAVVDPAGGAVGVTAAPAGVGLHGIGGIGKSVLAAAVAADDRVRRRFPDGVYWVTVGEQPDLLALQLDLLGRLGAPREARTTGEASAALHAALADRRVLLVVDDVWSDTAARAFRVAAGPRGRVLYTSRDPAVVAAAGARAHRIDVLSPGAARALAAAVLGVPVAGLPPVADPALVQVGHVPLAVALLAAAVRGGRPWEQVAADLVRDADVYGTHPYADTFRALHVAVTALPPDLRAALLGLAVFPPDTGVPATTIARYWAHTRGSTAAGTATDLDRLDAAHVLHRDGAVVAFHDLAHDYLLLHADDLPALHAQLLAAHGALLREPGRWWQLPPDEPYLRAHLASHLAGAGDRLVLVRTVTDPAYQAQRIAHDGPHAGEADLAVAARLLPDHPVVRWWRSWLPRHAHLLAVTDDEPATRTARTAATLLAWLDADPTRPREVRTERIAPLLPRPYPAVRGISTPATALRVLVGHTGVVRAVAWSPDGTRIATADLDGGVRVWSAGTGRAAVALDHGGARVRTLAWSPDGTRLASGDADGRVRLWDPATGRTTAARTASAGAIGAVAWSPDGRLATAAGRTVLLWDPGTGRELGRLSGHADPVTALAWSPDGAYLASADAAGTVVVWDRDGRRRCAVTLQHVTCLAWSSTALAAGQWGRPALLTLRDPADPAEG